MGFSLGFHIFLCASSGMICEETKKPGADAFLLAPPPLPAHHSLIEAKRNLLLLRIQLRAKKVFWVFFYMKKFQVCMKILSKQQLKWRQLEIIKEACSGQWLKQDGISTLSVSLSLSLSFYGTSGKLGLLLKLELTLWLWELENYFTPSLSRDHSTDFQGCYCKWINEHIWN